MPVGNTGEIIMEEVMASRRLETLGAELRKAWNEGKVAPTLMAPKMVAVIDAWDPEEADGATPNQWISSILGRCTNGTTKGAWEGYFRRLADGKSRFGALALRLDYQALVWGNTKLSDDDLEKVKMRLHKGSREAGGIMGKEQLRRICRDALGWKPKPQACEGCKQLLARVKQLEAYIVEAGGEVPGYD
jgi:hypothetical protein